MTNEPSPAQERYTAASRRVSLALTMKEGGVGAENNYGAAYRALVAEGRALPLRAKYRSAKHGGGRKA